MSVLNGSGSLLGNGFRVGLRYLLVAGGISAGLGVFFSRWRGRHDDPTSTERSVDDLLSEPVETNTQVRRDASPLLRSKPVIEVTATRICSAHRLSNIYALRKNKRAGRGAASII